MVRVSNALIGTLNVLSAIVSLFLVGISLYYQFHGGSTCQKFIQTPLLITGVTLFVVSIIGLMGSCGKMNFFLYLYLIVMFLCIMGLIGFTVFAFIVTNAGAGTALSGRGFKEYRLGDYSNWLQNHIVNGERWDRIRSCLADAEVCSALAKQEGLTLASFPVGLLQAPSRVWVRLQERDLLDSPQLGTRRGQQRLQDLEQPAEHTVLLLRLLQGRLPWKHKAALESPPHHQRLPDRLRDHHLQHGLLCLSEQ